MIRFIRHLGVSFVVCGLFLLSGCAGDDNSSPVASSSSPAPGGGYGGGGGDGYGGGGGYGGYDDAAGDGDEVDAEDGSDTDSSDAYGENAGGGYGNQSPGYGNQSPGYGNQSPGYGGYPDAAAGAGDAYAGGYGGGGGSDFQAQIEPILRARCFNCHGGGPDASKGDLELNSQDAISSVVRQNNPDDSEMFVRITMAEDEEGKMPPKGPRLTQDQIDSIRNWIQSGARFEAGGGGGYASSDGYGGYDASGRGGDGYGDPTGRQPQTPPPPKTLMDVASLAFRNGNDTAAMQHWFAQSLVNSEDGNSVLKKYRWVSGLKRPVLAVRWGMGVEFTKQGNWGSGPKPIGVNQDIPQRSSGGDRDRSGGSYAGGGRGGGGNAGGGFDAVDEGYADFTNEALDYYTGLLGATLIERLQMRIERSFYGDGLKDELEKALTGDPDGGFDGDDGYGGGGFGGGGGYGGYASGGNARGGFGDGGYGRGAGAGGNDEEAPVSKIEQIMPGVTMLGVGSQSELFLKAHGEGVDALVIFEVKVERNIRARLIFNTTKIRLFDVATETQLAVTRGLHNVTLQKQVEKDPEDDTINIEIDKIFAAADEKYRCVEFPSQIKPEHVVRRVERLLAQSRDNPLGQLSEIRFYLSRDLLTDAQLNAAYTEILPGKADELAKVSDDDQIKSLLGQWLPKTESPLRDTEDGEDEDGSRRRAREFR